jgi:hypothetical protein
LQWDSSHTMSRRRGSDGKAVRSAMEKSSGQVDQVRAL